MEREILPLPNGSEIVLDLYRAAYACHSRFLYRDCIAELGKELYTDRQVRRWIGSPLGWAASRASAATAIVYCRGHLLGFIGLKDRSFVDMIAVAPEHARRGIGTVLLAWAIREANLAKEAELTTVASPLARKFFECHGFKIERDLKRSEGGVVIKSYAMYLELCDVDVARYEAMSALVPHFNLRVDALPGEVPKIWSRRWLGLPCKGRPRPSDPPLLPRGSLRLGKQCMRYPVEGMKVD